MKRSFNFFLTFVLVIASLSFVASLKKRLPANINTNNLIDNRRIMLKKRQNIGDDEECVSTWPGEYRNQSHGTGEVIDQIFNSSATANVVAPQETATSDVSIVAPSVTASQLPQPPVLVRRGVCPPASPQPDYSQEYAEGQGKPGSQNSNQANGAIYSFNHGYGLFVGLMVGLFTTLLGFVL